jgi:hypothetical protein
MLFSTTIIVLIKLYSTSNKSNMFSAIIQGYKEIIDKRGSE